MAPDVDRQAPVTAAPATDLPWFWGFLIFVAALAPMLLNPHAWAAPWIAEDASILRYVAAGSPWVDWSGPQYGLRLVSFWRPLITTSWDLQEAMTGLSPLALRIFNVALHATCALLIGKILRVLGGTLLSAGLGAAAVASFPYQGGTVVWLAGRTDLLCAALMLGALVLSLQRRTLPAVLLGFLACASKEFAFLLPAWLAALEWARGTSPRTILARAWPLAATVLVAFFLRTLFLGTLMGGYPAAPTAWTADLRGVVNAVGEGLGFQGGLALGALIGGTARGSAAWRLGLAGLVLFFLGVAPLYPLLKSGPLSPQNVRLFFLAELGLAVMAASGFARSDRSRRTLVPLLFLVGLFVVRLGWARADVAAWADSAHAGEALVERARGAVASAAPGSGPVLVPGLPTSHGPAYCLGYGAADRFRAPFPASPRPVWPLRPLFGFDASLRPSAVAPRPDGTVWPLDDPPAVPVLRLASAPSLEIDERVLGTGADESPSLEIQGAYPQAGFELLLHTEMGYEPLPWRVAGTADRHPFTLREVMNLSNGTVSGGQILMQTADLQGRRAYLEVRAVGVDGTLFAASRWIELTWAEGFLAQALGG